MADRGEYWAELERLVERSGGQGRKLSPEEIYRLAALYRSAAADLAVARRSWPDTSGTLRLQALVTRANAVVYSKPAREDTAVEFLSVRIWREIRALDGCLVISAGDLVRLRGARGPVGLRRSPRSASGLLPAGFHATAHPGKGAFYGVSIVGRSGLAVQIFINNIEVAILAVAGGFTFGLMTAFSLAYNGAILGILGALEWRAGGFGHFFSLIVPHGLLELSCITVAGAGGLAVARALIDPGNDTRSEALGRLTPTIGAVVLAVMLFLVVAGLTEGIVTPWDLSPPVALLIGIALAGGFWSSVLFRGRRATRRRPHCQVRSTAMGLQAGLLL